MFEAIDEIVADRAPQSCDQYLVILASDGKVLGEVTVDVWIDESVLSQIVQLDDERAADVVRGVRGAVRVWADDFIIATFPLDTVARYVWAFGGGAVTSDSKGISDWREEAAFHLFRRAGGQIARRDGNADYLLLATADLPSPLLVERREIEGRAALVLCTASELTVDEATFHAAATLSRRLRGSWASVDAPSDDERWQALVDVIQIYLGHEGMRMEYLKRRRAQKQAARRRNGNVPSVESAIPMYFLAARGGRTKPHGLPQRVAARALRLLDFSEDEIAAFLGSVTTAAADVCAGLEVVAERARARCRASVSSRECDAQEVASEGCTRLLAADVLRAARAGAELRSASLERADHLEHSLLDELAVAERALHARTSSSTASNFFRGISSTTRPP